MECTQIYAVPFSFGSELAFWLFFFFSLGVYGWIQEIYGFQREEMILYY